MPTPRLFVLVLVAVALTAPGGIVALDDTWLDFEDKYVGKGKLAVPILLANGFEIIAATKTTVVLRRQ